MDRRRAPADAPARYQIRVRGALDPHWSDWFAGMTIAEGAGGDTVLAGLLADQASLFGVLHRIRDLGLVLLSVVRLPEHAGESLPAE